MVPRSSCEMIILRNNNHGKIIRVRMGIFTTAHGALLVTVITLKGTHFSELSISKFSGRLISKRENANAYIFQNLLG